MQQITRRPKIKFLHTIDINNGILGLLKDWLLQNTRHSDIYSPGMLTMVGYACILFRLPGNHNIE